MPRNRPPRDLQHDATRLVSTLLELIAVFVMGLGVAALMLTVFLGLDVEDAMRRLWRVSGSYVSGSAQERDFVHLFIAAVIGVGLIVAWVSRLALRQLRTASLCGTERR